MNPIDLFIAELEHEMTATMRQLEAIPAAKLEWQPHPKSMSIGKLGMHIATIPGQICQMATLDVFEFPENFGVPQPASKEEILDMIKAKKMKEHLRT